MSTFLSSAKKQFQYYQALGLQTMDQLSDEQIFDESQHEINNISVIVKHLHGNMMSRWTDFLTSDGEKEWRDREGEFNFDIKSREELLKKWNEGWNQLYAALELVQDTDLEQLVYIRNGGHTIIEAINRQLCHYAYHVGQIVYIGKLYKGSDWKSLSIPRGASQTFNKTRFDQSKKKRHFTDD